MYRVETTSKFKRDFERIKKRKKDLKRFYEVVALLSASDKSLPAKYKDHKLSGDLAGYRECHIENDWLLIYKKEKDKLILLLTQTGNHSDLF